MSRPSCERWRRPRTRVRDEGVSRRSAQRAAAILFAVASALPSACTLRCDTGSPKLHTLPADPAEQAAAGNLASEFLLALDQDRAAEIYPGLSAAFRDLVPELAFRALVATTRAGAGTPLSRRFLHSAYTEALPDAPPGRYFVIEYEAKFSERSFKERVVARFEGGAWKVAGYFAFKNIFDD